MSLHGAYDDNNLFAKILRGEIPSVKVYEDDEMLAFMDIYPQTRGHVLVVPKNVRARNFLELPVNRVGPLMERVHKLAIATEKALKPDGVTVTQFNGEDAERRQDWVLRGFRQFDAPVCVIVTYDRVLDGSDDTPFDCGAVTNALVNAAWSRGLGAVINSQGIMQSPVVREHAGIADDQVIMKSIALGWPDDSFPANAVVSERKRVDETAVFVGFDD
jgi:hypothetical protein